MANCPSSGLEINLDQANALLAPIPLTAVGLREISKGYNNKAYVAEIDDGSEVVLRLTRDIWKGKKSAVEAAALRYVKENTRVPVPTVLHVSNEKVDGVDVVGEYMVLEKMPGVDLEVVWPEMSLEEKSAVLNTLGSYVAEFQSCRFDKIGGLCWSEIDGYSVTYNTDGLTGPYDSFADFVSVTSLQAMDQVQELPEAAGEERIIQRARETLKRLVSEDGQFGPANDDVPIVFCHNDFTLRNMLVDGTTVTGIVDFEFAGAFPLDYDWEDSVGELLNHVRQGDDGLSPEDRVALEQAFKDGITSNGGVFPLGTDEECDKYRDRIKLYEITQELMPWRIFHCAEDDTEGRTAATRAVFDGMELLTATFN